jgi:hypothetical protein
MPADRQLGAIDELLAIELVDHRGEVLLQVGDVVVIHAPRGADDRRREVGDCVPLRDEVFDRARPGLREAVDVLGT